MTSNPDVETHGLQERLRLDQLVAVADAVVRGQVTDERVVRFTPGPDVLPGTYTVSAFRVTDALKGTSSELEIAHSPKFGPDLQTDTGGHSHGPRPGTDHVLFLFRGDEVWGERYLVLGDQGLGSVVGNDLRLADGRSFPLAALKGLAPAE